jgi:hypothetical protein
VFGGRTRTWLDVVLYAALIGSLLRALVAPSIGTAQLLPIVVLLALCGLGDKTILLAARVEHHGAMIVCFLLAESWIPGCKAVQLAVWFWAGVSKLTVAFGYVIPVMTVNNPLLRSPSLRRRMFVSYPSDLTPSRLGKIMAHTGTFLELAAPLTLLFVTHGGPLLVIGMIFVVLLHGFIINSTCGQGRQWNLVSCTPPFPLRRVSASRSRYRLPLRRSISPSPSCFLPLIGNLVPRRVSFLVVATAATGRGTPSCSAVPATPSSRA